MGLILPECGAGSDTKEGAVGYYLMDWDSAFDTLEMILRMRRTVAE